jgi:triacylglycerol lipase
VTGDPAAAKRWWGRPVAELRWSLEGARLLADPVFHGRDVARGDGRPVLLLPGFLAGDYTLAPLATWLARIGYRPAVAGFVANVGCSERALQRVARRAAQLRDAHGRRVAVVGHSRGGHYARALAVRRPELVAHAVSIGGGLTEQQSVSAPTAAAVAAVRAIHHRTTDRRARNGCLRADCACAFGGDYRAALPEGVRLTSIYSREDGVVRWESCRAPDAECIEVTGSHVGLVVNRLVYRALAGALSTDPYNPETPTP